MKKLLGISLVALLAVSPMMAMAAAPEGDVTTPAEGTVATEGPYYETVSATATTDIASTSYVKGAYNDAIKAVNKTYNELDSRLDSAESFISDINTTHAKVDLSNLDESGIAVIDSRVNANAAGAAYNSGTSGMAASTIQSAIDVLDSRVDTLETNLTSTANEIKAGVVSTINHSGTLVHTTWGADTVAYAADTVRAASDPNYNEYYDTYDATATIVSDAYESSGPTLQQPRVEP